MNERRRAFLKELLYDVGDERWDLIVNDFHKGDDEFDYAIVHAGTGKSMNRINLGDWDYFGMYLGDYETPEMQEGTGKDCYVDAYKELNNREKEEMLLALNQAIIDELEAQGQYEDEEGDEYE